MAKSFITSDQTLALSSTAISMSDLYTKVKAALNESGAVIVDDYVDVSNNLILVMKETFTAVSNVPVYWTMKFNVSAGTCFNEGPMLNWNSSTHTGSAKLANISYSAVNYAATTSTVAGGTQMTVSVLYGTRHRFIRIGIINGTNTTSTHNLVGIEAMQDAPSGWDSTLYPYVTLVYGSFFSATNNIYYTSNASRYLPAAKQTATPTLTVGSARYLSPSFINSTVTGGKVIVNNLIALHQEGYQLRTSSDFYSVSPMDSTMIYRDMIIVSPGVEEYMVIGNITTGNGGEAIRVV